MERICVHSPTKMLWEPQPQQGADAPVRELGLQVGGHAGYVDARVRDDDAGALADHVLRHIEPAMTMFQVLVTISTAQKVLKIHLKKIQVSKSWRLFFSMMSWMSS